MQDEDGTLVAMEAAYAQPSFLNSSDPPTAAPTPTPTAGPHPAIFTAFATGIPALDNMQLYPAAQEVRYLPWQRHQPTCQSQLCSLPYRFSL